MIGITQALLIFPTPALQYAWDSHLTSRGHHQILFHALFTHVHMAIPGRQGNDFQAENTNNW